MRNLIVVLLFFTSILCAQEKQEKKEKWYSDKFQLLYGKHVYPSPLHKSFRIRLGGGAKNIILNQVLTVGATPIEFIGFKPLITYTLEHHSFTGPCYGCNGISWEESIRRYQHSIFTHSVGIGLFKEFKFKLFKKDFQINAGITLERIFPNNATVYFNGNVFLKPQLSKSTNAFYIHNYYKDLLEIRLVKNSKYNLFLTFNGILFRKDSTDFYWPLEYSLTSLIIGLKFIL